MEASLSRYCLLVYMVDIIDLFASAFVGLGTMLMMIPVQVYIGKQITKVEKGKMERVSVVVFLYVFTS